MYLRTSKYTGYALLAIFGFLIVFQILLVLGMNIPGAAWGSRQEILPPGLRIASFFAIWILVFASCAVLEKIGVISIFRKPGLVNGTLWFFAAYFLFNTAMNALSPGSIEKYVMTPVALTASILCMAVVRGE